MQINQHQFLLIKSSKLNQYINDVFCDFLSNIYRENTNTVLTFNLELLNSDLNTLLLKDQLFFKNLIELKSKTNQTVNNEEKSIRLSFKIDDSRLPVIIEAERFINEKGEVSFPYSKKVEEDMDKIRLAYNNQKKQLELQLSNIDIAMEEVNKQVENLIKLNDEAKRAKDEIGNLDV